DRWMLLLLPGSGFQSDRDDRSAQRSAGRVENLTPADERPTADPGRRAPDGRPDPCDVDSAVRFADAGDYAGARAALVRATATCSEAAAPWRELAGVDAIDGNWDAAAVHARRAVGIDPDDAHAWRILATAEYLRHHDAAALDAWNHIGEPTVDLVDVKGLHGTRYAAVADAMGIAPGQ